MKRHLIVGLGVALGFAIAGCTPAEPPKTPDPTPTLTLPTPTPTPEFNETEQQAIDAVQRFLEVWAELGHDLRNADVDALMEVAAEDEFFNAHDVWANWARHDWHLVGAPTFTPTIVNTGPMDWEGDRYHVYGCYDITDVYVADKDGNPVEGPGRVDRGIHHFLVTFYKADGAIRVTDSSMMGESC